MTYESYNNYNFLNYNNRIPANCKSKQNLIDNEVKARVKAFPIFLK